MTRLSLVASLVAGAAAAAPSLTYGQYQEGSPARLVSFINDPFEPEFGDVFTLNLSLRFAPDMVAFVPDTLLPDEHSFSAGRGRWTAAPGPADSIDVQATYPIMGLLTGGIQLPWLEIWSRPAAVGESAGPRPAAELVALSEAGRAALRRSVIEIGGALILVPEEMRGEEASIDPRPPADVLGGEWSVWLLGAVGVSSLALLLVAGMVVGARRREADLGPLAAAPDPRAEALRELDDLLACGWHTGERVTEFYDAATGVLRQLSEVEEPGWSRALTSTELVDRIRERWGDGRVAKLSPAIWAAERVKFGDHRPGPEVAEADWAAVRDWIRELPEV